MNERHLKHLILSALFLALAFILPFFTGQIQTIGAMLLPMHFPVLITGFVCGAPWGLAVGLVAPLLRSVTLGMPLFFPNAVCMSAELAAYGAFAGLFRKLLPQKRPYLYPALLLSMLSGRLVWGGAMLLCMNIKGGAFTLSAFWAGAVTGALPGILAQLVLIPPIVMLLSGKTFSRHEN